jgi:hypothetical protein
MADREWLHFLVSCGTTPSPVEWEESSGRGENLVVDLVRRGNSQYWFLLPWIQPASGALGLASGGGPTPGDPIHSRLSGHSLFGCGAERICGGFGG